MEDDEDDHKVKVNLRMRRSRLLFRKSKYFVIVLVMNVLMRSVHSRSSGSRCFVPPLLCMAVVFDGVQPV